MKTIYTVILTGILLLYPFGVYFGLHYFSPSTLAILLLLVVAARFYYFRKDRVKIPWLLPVTFMGGLAVVWSLITNHEMGFKTYPIAVNFAMLLVFSYSYFKPPTVIESFARLTEKNMSAAAVAYTTKVTLIWCLFFIVNGAISLYTAVQSSMKVWTIYNGFVSYVLMGILMTTEFVIRKRVKKSHDLNEQPHEIITKTQNPNE